MMMVGTKFFTFFSITTTLLFFIPCSRASQHANNNNDINNNNNNNNNNNTCSIMSSSSSFFSPYSNIIEHTLANADNENVSPKYETLSTTQVTLLDNGILKFEPTAAAAATVGVGVDTSLIISCGIHGDETAPIEIISNIINDLLAEKLVCTQRVLFILGNPWAMAANVRFIDFNMNRMFSGNWQSDELSSLKEAKRASELEAHVAKFLKEEPSTITKRYHYDCHTMIRGSTCERFAVNPLQSPLSEIQQKILNIAHVNTVLLSSGEPTTFSAFTSSKHDMESFTLELGKISLFGKNDLSRFSGVDKALRLLIAGETLDDDDAAAAASPPSFDYYQVCHNILRTDFNWKFHVADDVLNFSEFQPGVCIWENDNNERYVVGNDEPEYIVFPNRNVPVGQRAGLMLKKVKMG